MNTKEFLSFSLFIWSFHLLHMTKGCSTRSSYCLTHNVDGKIKQFVIVLVVGAFFLDWFWRAPRHSTSRAICHDLVKRECNDLGRLKKTSPVHPSQTSRVPQRSFIIKKQQRSPNGISPNGRRTRRNRNKEGNDKGEFQTTERRKRKERGREKKRFFLVVWSAADDFFACRSQQNGVFKLCRIAALDIAQWRVWVHYPFIAQVFESHQVFGLVQPVQPPPAKGQRAKVLIDHV